MTTEQKARAYDRALEKAKQELKDCSSVDCETTRQIFRLFPELKERPLTPFQIYLNQMLRKVYFAQLSDKEVTDYIVRLIRRNTNALIELIKYEKLPKDDY